MTGRVASPTGLHASEQQQRHVQMGSGLGTIGNKPEGSAPEEGEDTNTARENNNVPALAHDDV